MWSTNIAFAVLCIVLEISSIGAEWSCVSNEDCSTLPGRICTDGSCQCPLGQQITMGGSMCSDIAPYYWSGCVDDYQCAGLLTGYTCSKDPDASEGRCRCQADHHYLNGRCWRSADYQQPCSRSEECQNVLRDPFSMSCVDGTCDCSAGYYLRQAGECRLIGAAPGAGCVLDEDCQFSNGACDASFTCYDTTVDLGATRTSPFNASLKMADSNNKMAVNQNKMAVRQLVSCNSNNACQAPFECSSLGVCVCPREYYTNDDGSLCLAELGTRTSSAEECSGLFAVIRDGRCSCGANIYYDENMRDCVKATRNLMDSCVSDAMCHTFGSAAVCGPPQEPWGLRSCRCQPELSVWSEERAMCRFFAGIGETCAVDSDCLAGDAEIVCLPDEEGVGRCACPEGLVADGGLCLNLGLELGASCQATLECSSKTEYSVCEAGVCACSTGYQQSGDLCLPEIGGVCAVNSDCTVQNTVCVAADGSSASTCQCRDDLVSAEGQCWTVSSGYNSTCVISEQCSAAIGAGAVCRDEVCVCAESQHFKDGLCNPQTGLFETCSRSSQCYLPGISDRVVCRNSLCQCLFEYPYLEDQQTCAGAATIFSNAILIIATLTYLYHSY